MATQRRYSIEFKRQVVQEYQAGRDPARARQASRHFSATWCDLGRQGGGRRVR